MVGGAVVGVVVVVARVAISVLTAEARDKISQARSLVV